MDSLMARRAAILRWTGRGKASDLQSSVQHMLKERGARAGVSAVGGSLVVTGPEPTGVCLAFEKMPGVAWTAAGYTVSGPREAARVASGLAANYLRPGSRFSVQAEVSGRGVASDLAGAMTSAILGKVKGARASNDGSKVVFRGAMDGAKGVVGVEVARGPGGVPMGRDGVVCLVSGGRHSSVLAWDAVLQGFRVKLVHAASGERSVLAAAGLYSELSNRADPRGISLTVVEGGSPAGLLSRFAAGCREPVYGGFTPARPPPAALVKALSPLYMMSEEAFDAEFDSLRLKSDDEVTDWEGGPARALSSRTFGGKMSDVSGVIDGLV